MALFDRTHNRSTSVSEWGLVVWGWEKALFDKTNYRKIKRAKRRQGARALASGVKLLGVGRWFCLKRRIFVKKNKYRKAK